METNVSPQAASSNAEQPKQKRLSSRTKLNLALDITLALAIVFIVWTTGMMRVAFPSPTRAEGWTLWGLTLNQWSDIQFYALCVFTVLSIEHVVLHWKWICGVVFCKMLKMNKPDEGTLAMYGIGAAIGLLFVIMISLYVAMISAQQPA